MMDFDKLKRQVDSSYADLRDYRDMMARDVRQFSGDAQTRWSEFADIDDSRPLVNMLEVLIGIYMQKLVSGNPRCRVTTVDPALKATARHFGLAMNRIFDKIGLRENLKMLVLQSLFGIGVMKTGICLEDEGAYGSDWHYSAVPYADVVTTTDYVFDVRAERWDLIRWEGNYYAEHIDDIRADGRNDQAVVATLTPGKGISLIEPNPLDDEILNPSSVASEMDDDFVRLVDIYVHRDNVIVTYPADGDKPLRIQRYIGPDGGPYTRLFYTPVPGRLMPLAPSRSAAPLSNLLSLLWKDMGFNASREKSLLLVNVAAAGQDDAAKINAARNGESIPVQDPNSCTEKSFGGVTQNSLGFAAAVREVMDFTSGNMSVLGGLASGAPTLGQEQLLASSSSGKMQAMQYEVVAATTAIIRKLAWYVWHDPESKIKTIDKIAGTDIEFPISFPVRTDMNGQRVDDRDGVKQTEFSFNIEPFSLQPVPPSGKLQMLMQVLQTQLLPAAQLLAQNGLTIDYQEVVDLIADLGDMPEIKDIVKSAQPQETPGDGPEFEKPPKPAHTIREYTRSRGGGPSAAGANRALAAGISNDKGSQA